MLQKVKVSSHTMPGRQGRSIMNTKEHEVMKMRGSADVSYLPVIPLSLAGSPIQMSWYVSHCLQIKRE